MGRGQHLRQWKELILTDQGLSHVDLLLGVFDEPVEALLCEDIDRLGLTCVSSADTSWTVGRNKLAKAAYQIENGSNLKYTYWTFADSDCILRCVWSKDSQTYSPATNALQYMTCFYNKL
jgi:hypothetical protein